VSTDRRTDRQTNSSIPPNFVAGGIKMVFPFVAPYDPWAQGTMIVKYFINFVICTISGSFQENLSFSGLVVLEKKIFKLPTL
jgi:hypothetical protein